ncbi:MAG: hypothetical protein ABSH32_06475 [Bryobacteraceae bacterium]
MLHSRSSLTHPDDLVAIECPTACAGPVQATSGNLYVTLVGRPHGLATVFSITPEGALNKQMMARSGFITGRLSTALTE